MNKEEKLEEILDQVIDLLGDSWRCTLVGRSIENPDKGFIFSNDELQNALEFIRIKAGQ